MNQIALSWRTKMGLVVAGYAAVLALAALWIIQRYLAEKRDPADFSGGMAAGGDWFLELIIIGMLLVPTFFLVLFIRNSEAAYTKFAKILLGFALSAPASLALMAIPAIGQTNQLPGSLFGSVCLYRVFSFPMTVVGLVGCCVLAKFKRPRRLILYSLVVEIMTFVLLLGSTMGKLLTIEK
jgi:hypothetical protein